MDNNEQQLTTMDNKGQQWTTMDNNGQQWTTIDSENVLTYQCQMSHVKGISISNDKCQVSWHINVKCQMSNVMVMAYQCKM